MKKYIRSANALTNKTTQLVSKKFSDQEIARRSEDVRKGESMMQIFQNIYTDPKVSYGDADASGNQDLLYDGKKIGWINFRRRIGNIDEIAYKKIRAEAAHRSAETNDSVAPNRIDDSIEDEEEFGEDEQTYGDGPEFTE